MECRSRPARWLLAVLFTSGVLALVARYLVVPLFYWRVAESCERPNYEVVGHLQAPVREGQPLEVELRRYEPYLVAEVQLPRGLSEEQRRALGFNQVAGYIFGGNLRRRAGPLGRWGPTWMATEPEPEKIAMTAPLLTEVGTATQLSATQEEAGPSVVSFTMPSMYKALNQLPVPTNQNVTLRAVPEHYAAVVGFRGPPPRAAKVAEMRTAMQEALEDAGLEPEEDRGVLVYEYHDPFLTPSLLRWNEVVLLVQPDGVEEITEAQKLEG